MKNDIKLNYIFDTNRFIVEPLNGRRSWMDETSDKYAYKCLPLTVANQYGWGVYGPTGFTAEWDGREDIDSIKVQYDEEDNFVSSHFGHGILTISVDFLVTTNSSVSIFIQGAPNLFKDGIVPLSGIVETDWLPFTFTFNYRFTRPGKVRFEKEDVLFSFFPIERGYIESFSTSYGNIKENEKLSKDFDAYNKSRHNYLQNNTGSFQKFYINTYTPNKNFNVPDHSTKIKIGKFFT
jgi:hypothetical protein